MLKSHIMINFWILVCGMIAIEGNAQSQRKDAQLFHKLTWDEIKPSAMQMEAMDADSPKGVPYLDHESHALWLSGGTNIWKWNLLDGSVARLELPGTRRGGFKIIFANSQLILGMDAQSVWQFKFKESDWRRFDGSIGPDCQIQKVIPFDQISNHKIYVSSNCGLYLIQLTTLQLIRCMGVEFSAKNFLVTDAAAIDEFSYVVASEQRLVKLMVDGPRLRQTELYRAKSKILGVTKFNQSYWAWTTQAIIVFDNKWNRLQVIPVSGSRKILGFAAGQSKHIVSFSDGNLEIMDLATRTKWASLNHGLLAQQILISKNEHWAVLANEDKLPRVFSVTNLR